jgi:thymidylate synthase (FAD)
MKNIEVEVLKETQDPAKMMMFLAKLTQRGHNIQSMNDLLYLYNTALTGCACDTVARVAALPHGTIKRFSPITIAIVGASRRFLAQARTNQVGFNYVSASLQYSNYTDKASFVVPYELHELDERLQSNEASGRYLESCEKSMVVYKDMCNYGISNDTAGYASPQGLRNILVMQANHEAWMHFIRLRSCNRNTVETQYVTMLIWEALLATQDGKELFKFAGPDCLYGQCREGKMSCGKPIQAIGECIPRSVIDSKWPLLKEVR